MSASAPITAEAILDLATAREFLSSGQARALRRRHGISREQAALACGVSHWTLGQWERGENFPRDSKAFQTYLKLILALSTVGAGRTGKPHAHA